MMRALATLSAFSVLSLSACVASNPIDASEREVQLATAERDWQPLQAGQLQGLYESVAIRGTAAGTLWKVYYVFEAEGRYTGAALVAQDAGLRFQVIAGTWSVDARGIVLDDAEAVPAFHAGDHVRIAAPTGEIILRRSELH